MGAMSELDRVAPPGLVRRGSRSSAERKTLYIAHDPHWKKFRRRTFGRRDIWSVRPCFLDPYCPLRNRFGSADRVVKPLAVLLPVSSSSSRASQSPGCISRGSSSGGVWRSSRSSARPQHKPPTGAAPCRTRFRSLLWTPTGPTRSEPTRGQSIRVLSSVAMSGKTSMAYGPTRAPEMLACLPIPRNRLPCRAKF